MTAENEQALATRTSKAVAPLQLSRHAIQITDGAAWELANRIKNSNIIPKDFIGKPENIFIAILMGREVGLPAMQAVQNIMVVNGRPCMWGDALPALVYASDKVAKFEEEIDPDGKWARCTVRRIGDQKDHVQVFTWADAVKAGYDKKPGSWQTSPKRMLQMRARAFALRDKFADVLKGLGMVEEAQDYEILDGNARTVEMPKEIEEINTKAAAFNAQETVVNGEIVTPSAAPAEPVEPGKEDPRIASAKKKFLDEFKVPAEAVDKYLTFHGHKDFPAQYARLKEVWKGLKDGKLKVKDEFGGFILPEKKAEPEGELGLE